MQKIGNVSKTHMYAGTYNTLPIELPATLKISKLTSLPSSFGNSPVKKCNDSKKHTTRVCWNIQLALERIAAQRELGQIGEVAELLGQFACKKTKG